MPGAKSFALSLINKVEARRNLDLQLLFASRHRDDGQELSQAHAL